MSYMSCTLILFRKLFILNVTINIDRVGNESIAVSQLLRGEL